VDTPQGVASASSVIEVRVGNLLANFEQVVKDKPVRIHPIVSQLLDPAVLDKMKVSAVGEAKEGVN